MIDSGNQVLESVIFIAFLGLRFENDILDGRRLGHGLDSHLNNKMSIISSSLTASSSEYHEICL